MTDAHEITLALGGKWFRRYGAAPCPVCQPSGHKLQNALTLADGNNGRLLLNCKKSACSFLDILVAAGIGSGEYNAPDPSTIAAREAQQRADEQKRAAQAEHVWRESQPIQGTLAEGYLRSCGIVGPLPKALRFHAACWHGPTAKRYPAMIAAIQGNRLPAVHRLTCGAMDWAKPTSKDQGQCWERSQEPLCDSLRPMSSLSYVRESKLD